MRHLWGDPQYDIHAGGQELFLDLIFVGVAYRVGLVLKKSFYSCSPTHITDESSSYGSSSSGDGRRLAAEGYLECTSLQVGVLHALAPFMCMYVSPQPPHAHFAPVLCRQSLQQSEPPVTC